MGTAQLGVCEYRLENYAEAVDVLEDFLTKFPESENVPSASLFGGESLVKLGKHQRAVEHLARITLEHPDDPACSASLLRLGESLAFLQSFHRSESAFGKEGRWRTRLVAVRPFDNRTSFDNYWIFAFSSRMVWRT